MTPTEVEPIEVEIKLGVTRPRAVRALLTRADPDRLAGFEATGPPSIVVVTDRYVDTDAVDGALFQAAIRVRLRTRRGKITLTVKRPSVEAAGVTTRVELEAPATRSLRPLRWGPSPARAALLDALGAEPLRVIAEVRQRRLVRHLRRGATTVELSLDSLGAIVAGRVVARRHELEAELVDGSETDLAELGDALRQVDGVGPALGSKLAFALDARLAR